VSENVSDFMRGRLSEWRVRRIYGYHGGGINGIMRGDFTAKAARLSTCRCATRRWPRSCLRPRQAHRRSGISLATSGPGAIHLLKGLYDADLGHQPVVAIGGQPGVRARRGQEASGDEEEGVRSIL